MIVEEGTKFSAGKSFYLICRRDQIAAPMARDSQLNISVRSSQVEIRSKSEPARRPAAYPSTLWV